MLRSSVAVLSAVILSGCVADMMSGDPMPDGQPADWGPIGDGADPQAVRFNQVQMRGTVNSYHDYWGDGIYPEFVYRHLPLDEQAAEQGIRQFDFDLAADRGSGITLSPQTSEHLFDDANHCGDWLGCLWELRDWSDAHPDHPMVVVLVGETALMPHSPPWMHHQFDALESDVVSALGRQRVYTPADMRRGFPSLQAAVAARGWPAIDATRGKVLFVLNDRGVARFEYIMNGGEDPDDRLLFVMGDPALVDDPAFSDEVIFTFEPNGPWVYETDPAALRRMAALVEAGFLVHATTDDPDFAAELRDVGVHMIGTRFPEMLGPILDGPMICNPITRPGGCAGHVIEPDGR